MEQVEIISGMRWRGGGTTAEGHGAAVERTRAFEALVAEHARVVFRVAYSVLRNTHDAEDAVQETFLSAWQASFENAEDPKAWLAKIAWRAALRKAKQRPEQANAEEVEISSDLPDPEQQASANERRQLLDRMVAALPGDLRSALVLLTMGEMKSSEIAAVLGIPEASVRTRLFRARQMLKEKLTARKARTEITVQSR